MNVVVGRVAGRIRGSCFSIGGQSFSLEANAGADHLHGGAEGLHRARFEMRVDGESLLLSHRSAAGAGGYPGELFVSVRYTLEGSCLDVELEAESDAVTPVNLTHHGYFNLAGVESQSVLDHELWIASKRIATNDADLLPTGAFEDVLGTHLDFTTMRTVRGAIDAERLTPRGGLDHSFALDGNADPMQVRPVARLFEPTSGRCLELSTSAPCLQVYSANFLNVPGGKAGALVPHSAICLEAQGFPDAVNQPAFPSVLLAPGEPYRNRIRLDFSVVPKNGS